MGHLLDYSTMNCANKVEWVENANRFATPFSIKRDAGQIDGGQLNMIRETTERRTNIQNNEVAEEL